jgi:hypothetical protein
LKTDIEVLDDAIGLIEADDGWCQGATCKDAAGHHLFPSSQFATRWGWADAEGLHAGQPVTFCLEGAIRQAARWPPFWTCGTSVVQARQQAANAAELKQQAARLDGLAYRLALQDMTGGIPSTWGSLHDFNDDDYTTQEEAILVLKRVRAQIEEHG